MEQLLIERGELPDLTTMTDLTMRGRWIG